MVRACREAELEQGNGARLMDLPVSIAVQQSNVTSRPRATWLERKSIPIEKGHRTVFSAVDPKIRRLS